MLFLLLRNVLLPLKAVLVNLLSVGAAYGVLVAVFQWGWLDWIGYHSPGYVNTIVPALVLAVTFGLSMDYEVFLLTRIRERWLEHGDNDRAVAEGLVRSARVITSAAAVMVAVFLAFAIAGAPSLKEIGVGLGVAILLDATIVRLVDRAGRDAAARPLELVAAVVPQRQAVSWTSARCLSGSHQSRLRARTTSTVSRMPSSNPISGFQPSSLPELRRVEQVAAVVAGPVGDDRLQRLRLAGQLEDGVGDLLDRLLDARADVVRLADAAALEHELDRAAVVVDVQPLAPVLRRRVQRQLEIVERVRRRRAG